MVDSECPGSATAQMFLRFTPYYLKNLEYEGGLTQFGGDTKPNYALTLPAGYVWVCSSF